ncbi:MAG: HNH endonuclease [Deltaproteobacteria bacterium]|nr:HNH endonuclease [Deltaproteobacteria bacterium]
MATPANELAWLERAAGCTAREIERLVAGHALGADPDDTPDPAEVLTPVSFELTPTTRALLREARQQLHRDAGQRLDDDAFIAELLRRALAGNPRKPGTPSYQIAINVCDCCERVTQDGAGQVIDIDPAELHVALCDASIIDTTRPGAPATREVPAATRAAVVRRDHGRCKVPGCRNAAWVDLHHQVYRSQFGGHDAGNLLLLCTAHHHAVHDGRVIVTRDPRGHDGFGFRHADGRPYGAARAQGQTAAEAAPA